MRLGSGGLLGYGLSRQLSRRYLALVAASDRIAEGDLAPPGPELPTRGRLRDETDDLAERLRAMVAGLRELVARVQGSAQDVAASPTT